MSDTYKITVKQMEAGQGKIKFSVNYGGNDTFCLNMIINADTFEGAAEMAQTYLPAIQKRTIEQVRIVSIIEL